MLKNEFLKADRERERERARESERERDSMPCQKQGCHCLEFAESKMKEFHPVAIERHDSSCFTSTKGETVSLKWRHF